MKKNSDFERENSNYSIQYCQFHRKKKEEKKLIQKSILTILREKSNYWVISSQFHEKSEKLTEKKNQKISKPRFHYSSIYPLNLTIFFGLNRKLTFIVQKWCEGITLVIL